MYINTNFLDVTIDDKKQILMFKNEFPKQESSYLTDLLVDIMLKAHEAKKDTRPDYRLDTVYLPNEQYNAICKAFNINPNQPVQFYNISLLPHSFEDMDIPLVSGDKNDEIQYHFTWTAFSMGTPIKRDDKYDMDFYIKHI